MNAFSSILPHPQILQESAKDGISVADQAFLDHLSSNTAQSNSQAEKNNSQVGESLFPL